MRCRSWPTRLKICDSLVVSDIKKQKHRITVFLLFLTYVVKPFVLAGCLHCASRRKALPRCVNVMQQKVNTPGGLHSSFVVFYFVFVFRLPPDVNHGATAFYVSLLKQSQSQFTGLFSMYWDMLLRSLVPRMAWS